jgi:RNA polymerase sporulation-specific sigma factor
VDSGFLRDHEQLSDEELVRLAVDDKAALTALLLRYVSLTEYIAAGLAPKAGREQMIKDLVQEGMMALLKAVNSYRPDRGAGFATYAGVCIRHSMLSYIMHDSRYSGSALPEEELVKLTDQSIESDPERLVIDREEYDELFKRIAEELSEKEWQVLRRFLAGLSHRQTAEALGTTEKSVNNTMQRVRRKLRGIFI